MTTRDRRSGAASKVRERNLTIAFATVSIMTTFALPWWNQMIFWIANNIIAGVVTHDRSFGGKLRTGAHLSGGAVILAVTIPAIDLLTATQQGADIILRGTLGAMTAASAYDAVLVVCIGSRPPQRDDRERGPATDARND